MMSNAARRACLWGLVLGAVLAPRGASAQLDRYDYEYLGFRGVGLEAGYLWANKVDPVATFGARFDLGYAGPGLRIVPGIRYWSSQLKQSEVTELEERLRQIIAEANPGEEPPAVDLGTVKWSDVVLTLDGHFVWEVPLGLLTYLGAGFSAHILNGSGDVVNETFLEDLLDRTSAGVNAHAGLEYLISPAVRLYGTARYEILDDLSYLALMGGFQFMFGGAPDEREEG
jgi:hypothetical protein